MKPLPSPHTRCFGVFLSSVWNHLCCLFLAAPGTTQSVRVTDTCMAAYWLEDQALLEDQDPGESVSRPTNHF